MLYLLDTNVCSDLMAEREQVLIRLSNLTSEDRVATSVISEGEIRFGIRNATTESGRKNLAAKAQILLEVLPRKPVPAAAADHYARLKLDMRERNKRAQQAGERIRGIDENDLWIAATCLTLGATLVTRDEGFKNAPDLVIQDWTT
jgi:tRNA(fMet)-specific endonuclease VapC